MDEFNGFEKKHDKLRDKAEKELESMKIKLESLPQDEARNISRLIHELQIHQIELEMQNNELCRIQQEIEASRRKYLDLYNFAPVGYITFNKQGKIREANLQISEMLGINRNTLIDSIFYTYILNEDTDTFYFHLNKVCSLKSRHSCEVRVKRSDGTHFYARIDSNLIENDDGSIDRCRASITDISEMKQVEIALRESEEKYRLLIENSNDAIYVLNGEHIEMVNKSFEEIFGVTSAEVNKSEFRFMHLVAPESRLFVQKKIKCSRNQEMEAARYEFKALTKSNKKIDVEVSQTFFKNNGDILIQGILRDVSERKRLEEQLLQAQKMEAIGKLAGGIAHDFNNLLTAIIGNAGILLSQLDDNAPEVEEVNEIQTAAERAALLTKQLLAYARKQPLMLELMNINKTINNIKNMLKRLIGENIELKISLDKRLGYVKADAGQISQVIMNLVVNAKDAIREHGKIIIKTENIKKSAIPHLDYNTNKYVCLSVEDSGIGIKESIKDKIFEPFFTTKNLAQSSGLGLSVVYGIVSQHDGLIDVISKAGKGTVFNIYLPVASDIPVLESKKQISISELKGNGERILLVEDEKIVRNNTIKILHKYNYKVKEAACASEALEVFEKEKGNFDLLFCDVILPDLKGIKLADKLLADHPRLPVLMCSGYADHELEWPVIQQKGYKFISKPYSLNDLLKMLRQIFD